MNQLTKGIMFNIISFRFLLTQLTKFLAYEVGIEVFTAVVMKSTILWDITPSSLLKVKRRFGGKTFNILHGGISQETILFNLRSACIYIGRNVYKVKR
jgi:hypothetical protein